MTKLRPALTFHLGLTKIAALLGWEAMAVVTDQKERTVRNWSDPDTGADVSMEHALMLDLAYRAAGGEGAPLLDTYRLRFDMSASDAEACGRELLIKTAASAKETGEALQALTLAALPGASKAVMARARLEAEEAITALTNTLPYLGGESDGAACTAGGTNA